MKDNKQKINKESVKKKISRKDAMKKMGFTALSAATMMILLNKPGKVNAQASPEMPPDWEW